MGFTDVIYRALRKTPVGSKLAHSYPYNFLPHQLAAILACLDEVLANHSEGELVEVGCCFGHTSIFLATHVAAVACRRNYGYRAYDTFGGFVAEDIDHELEQRSLPLKRDQFEGFRRNNLDWVQQSVDRNAARTIPITLHKTDASTHDFKEVKVPIFALIDVDLYRPTLNPLQRLWPRLPAGAVVVVDDCSLDEGGAPILDDKFSGGHAALLEFTAEHGIEIQYVADKLAVLRR